MADAVGFKGDEIMFSSNDTPAEDFQLARKLNATINLDDITHIDLFGARGRYSGYRVLPLQPGRAFCHCQQHYG